jgi:hypothetical protein
MIANTKSQAANKLQALDRARVELEKFFSDGSKEFKLGTKGNDPLALQCAASILGSVAMLASRVAGTPDMPKSLSTGGLVRPIERLERTAKTGGAAWRKAWSELPAASYYGVSAAYQRANRRVPMPRFIDAPPPSKLKSAIPGALREARKQGKEMPFRDNAVVTILQAYWVATGGQPTPKRTKLFIEKIENIFVRQGILPVGGLGVLKSAATLQRLIDQAIKAA